MDDLIPIPREAWERIKESVIDVDALNAVTPGNLGLRVVDGVVVPKDTKQPSFWVIERFEDGRSAGYWDGGSSRSFTTAIESAVQFVRQQDAFWATRGWHWKDTKITEHIMLSAAQEGE